MSSWSSDMWFDMEEAEAEAKGTIGRFVMLYKRPKKPPGCRICGAPRKKHCQHCAACTEDGSSMAIRRFL